MLMKMNNNISIDHINLNKFQDKCYATFQELYKLAVPLNINTDKIEYLYGIDITSELNYLDKLKVLDI